MPRVLIIQTAFIGDVILATALVEAVAILVPQAKIEVLVRKGNESLLANNPHISKVLIWDKRTQKTRNLFQLLRTIRKSRFDIIINTQRFGATGLLTALSGAKVTSGFEKNPFSWAFTHKYPHHIGDGTHEVERNQQLLAFLSPTELAKPRLYPSPNDYATVKPYTQNTYITISPQSVWFTKQYPAHKWVEFINSLPSAYTVYLVGGPGDVGKNDFIRSETIHPKVQNLAGKLSFLQSAALFASAQMNYVNDSGPLHICSAMNAPVTAVFCSTVPAFGFTPLSEIKHVIEADPTPPCKPCGLHGHKACPKKDFECAERIETGQLLSVLSS